MKSYFDINFNNFEIKISLLQHCAQSKPGNLIISPFSMATALALLSQGTNGTTYEQLRKVLYLNSDKTVVADQFHEYFGLIKKSAGQSELMVANQIYLQQRYQLKEKFQKTAVNKFFAGKKQKEKSKNWSNQTCFVHWMLFSWLMWSTSKATGSNHLNHILLAKTSFTLVKRK